MALHVLLSWFTRRWSLQLGWTWISRVKGNLMFLCCFIQMLVSCCKAWKYWSYIQTIIKLIQPLRERGVAKFLFLLFTVSLRDTQLAHATVPTRNVDTMSIKSITLFFLRGWWGRVPVVVKQFTYIDLTLYCHQNSQSCLIQHLCPVTAEDCTATQ